MGWLVGRALGYLTFHSSETTRLAKSRDGFVAIGITLLCYGLTELVEGYGFLAVFVSALTIRSAERKHSYHEHLHDFAEQIERLLMMIILVFFGAAMAEGSLFGALDWQVTAVAALTVLVVRPLSGLISLAGSAKLCDEKVAIAFYGIRGMGSFYYLAFALGHAEFDRIPSLWSTVCITVLFSIVLHGVTVTPVMRLLDRRRRRGTSRLDVRHK